MNLIVTTDVYAQQIATRSAQTSPPHPTTTLLPSPSLHRPHAIKITSPTDGQQVPIGKNLTISGTSMTTPTTATNSNNCQILIGVNRLKPYQQAIATGPGGPNDYSRWNFILTSKYTTLNEGPNNRITAAYTCANSPAVDPYSSVNVTGVASLDPSAVVVNTTIIQQNHPAPIEGNSTVRQNTTFVSSFQSPSTSTATSDTLLYLGYHGKSSAAGNDNTTAAGKTTTHSSSSGSSSDKTSTKTKDHHSSTNNPISKTKILKSFNNHSRRSSAGSNFHIFPFPFGR
jgi:hypothetical protein